ncbi:hypothetical protein GM3709_2371 [Geminocystis sp. NIES-3709]|nr:hypothetical protein GM3709_2371 [Geminocystis sp. NIES-3709]
MSPPQASHPLPERESFSLAKFNHIWIIDGSTVGINIILFFLNCFPSLAQF